MASLFRRMAFDTADMLRRSLPMMRGAADTDHSAICVCSSAVVRQALPILSAPAQVGCGFASAAPVSVAAVCADDWPYLDHKAAVTHAVCGRKAGNVHQITRPLLFQSMYPQCGQEVHRNTDPCIRKEWPGRKVDDGHSTARSAGVFQDSTVRGACVDTCRLTKACLDRASAQARPIWQVLCHSSPSVR